MAAAEPVLALEALAKPDVEHALRDDRVERRALGSGPDGADRAATELDRGGQPDIDEVARRAARPVRRCRSRRPPPGHDRGWIDRSDRPGGRHHAVAGPFQQPAGDRRPVGAIQRVEDVALGQGDLRGARAIGGGVRREELAGEALTTMRGLDAEGQQLLGLAIDPGDRETDDGVPDAPRP